MIELRSGPSQVQIDPSQGGALRAWCTRYGAEEHVWFDARYPASFLMVPFASRVADAQFGWRGARIALPQNFPPEPHSLHGFGWQAPWQVVSRAPSAVQMCYICPGASLPQSGEAGPWPWAFTASQRIEVRSSRLAITLAVHNTSRWPMPVGLGWHPFFNASSGCEVSARVAGQWQLDQDLLPLRHVAMDAPGMLHKASGSGEDALYTGWDRTARLVWPQRNASLVLRASPVFDKLVIYAPGAGGVLCVEPVSNAVDGFNLMAAGRAQHGIRVLAPGARLRAWIQIEVFCN